MAPHPPETVEWVEECHKEHEYLYPVCLPMLDEPQKWTSLVDGGYKTAFVGRKTLIKPSRRAYLRELEKADLSQVYSAVNEAQETAWELNQDVLEVLTYCWDKGLPVAELPPRENLPVADKPETFASPEERKEWKAVAMATHNLNRSFLSKRLSILQLLAQTRLFVGKTFYYPYHVDFRGRMYTIPKFLDPQGPDVARGLLRFAREEMMTTPEHVRHLAIHGANCFGLDKTPFAERLAFIAAEQTKILNVYRDPLDNRWWEEAEKPWQFLAFCFEWGRYLEQGLPCPTKLPCQVDGSNFRFWSSMRPRYL